MRSRKFASAGGMALGVAVTMQVSTACGFNECTDTHVDCECGPCGHVSLGDTDISGNAKLDGFFRAVVDIDRAVVALNGQFEEHLAELESGFGRMPAPDAPLTERVDAVVAAINAEVGAHTFAGLVVQYAPPSCHASAAIAVEAQAQCEAGAECWEANPDPPAVSCSGTCEGACEGGCEGTELCVTEGVAQDCAGACEGLCDLSAPAHCQGTCRGACSGSCSAFELDGSCAGMCVGDCDGTCELRGATFCDGTCTGSCTEATAAASCYGVVQCDGECVGDCARWCVGEVTVSATYENCRDAARCAPQARAQGSANVECTPVAVEIAFQPTSGLDAAAHAEWSAKVLALETHAAAMLESFVRYNALVEGEVSGEVAFSTSPVEVVIRELTAVIDAGLESDLFWDIAAGRMGCVIPAMEESVNLLEGISYDASRNLEAQGTFVGALTRGFSG